MINTAIIGAGGIAQKHAQALNRIPEVNVVGVLDPNEKNAQIVAEICGAKVITSLEEVLDEVQVIHLLTPPSKRVEYAETAMRAGKHILCEKPISVEMKDAITLSNLVKETGVTFMTAFNMRFRPGYLRLQEDVLSGKLGEIISVWSHRVGPGSGFNTPLGDSWRTNPNLVCGMSIESLSHDIDMLRGLGLEIENVTGWVKGSKPELPVFDNNAQVVMGLNNGASAVINASWASYLPMCSRGVIGTKGTAALLGDGFFDFMDYRLMTKDMKYEEITRINDPFDAESYYTENVHFIDCIKAKQPTMVNVDNGIEALKVSLAILEASKTGQVVKL